MQQTSNSSSCEGICLDAGSSNKRDQPRNNIDLFPLLNRVKRGSLALSI